MLPGTRNDVQKGIETAWTNLCDEGDTKIWYESATQERLLSNEEASKQRKSFRAKCNAGAAAGKTRYIRTGESISFKGAMWYVCCEDGCQPPG
jgi:hypothetical protein